MKYLLKLQVGFRQYRNQTKMNTIIECIYILAFHIMCLLKKGKGFVKMFDRFDEQQNFVEPIEHKLR